MLARLARELPVHGSHGADGPDGTAGADAGDRRLWYEPKWDGFRCMAFRDRDTVDLRSRNQRPLARYFPDVVAALVALL